jgi:ATP/maltotriose-dependent transcriptional regulator MalT
MWRGAWEEAERQLEAANVELSASRPPMAVEAVVRLAELRWRQGRWDEADALFRQVEHEGLSQLGRAEMALDRGEATEALDLAERALRRIPPDDRLERAPVLELKVRALAALAGPRAAEPALEELRAIATVAATDPLRASASLAAGALAASRGDHIPALPCLEDAVDFYHRSGAVFEGARARTLLARTLLALGRIESAARETSEALQAFRRLGARRAAIAAESLLREIADAAAAAGSATRGSVRAPGTTLSPREAEILALMARGRSNAEIAGTLVLSIRTVERHISNLYEKLGVAGRSARAAAVAYAVTAGLVAPDRPAP